MAKNSKLLKILTSVLVIMMLVSSTLAIHMSATTSPVISNQLNNTAPKEYVGDFINNYQQYFDNSVMYKLPDTVSDDTELSLIVKMKSTSLLEAYKSSDTSMSFEEFSKTKKADEIRAALAKEAEALQTQLNEAMLDYELGASYDTVLSGFEIVTKAVNFENVCKTLSTATVIVGEEYKTAETQLVENDVNFYENTGIFDSSSFGYNGSGTLVAVLDTGLDYFHSAFSDSNFAGYNNGNYALTLGELTGIVPSLSANNRHNGLTASDLYISNKVPYAFDYADGDPDVFPLLNEHGTHVAGVVAGHDDVITGVAPGAQLAIMKIFSDVMETSRTAWILSALEDCVALGVDVINMSIGTSCGFSRITDEESVSTVYEDIRELGINLVVAASNSYNSTYASDKNGNLPLTSNPDSGTVGSPSTYPASLSVASINGKKTPYILNGKKIIYFIEATDRVSEEKDFVEDLFKVDYLLTSGNDTIEIEYITIPGVGRSADYTGLDVKGKIALVQRGQTTFEEKAAVAKAKGAAGIIIYNNVSGDIKMNAGEVDDMPICSISQKDGEALAKTQSGKLKISRQQTSGPFISDFSSWGPAPDLSIKPEITAHGGNILSSVPGQSYDRISGTSMATPNIAGFSALMRQYVIDRFPELKDNPRDISMVVNRLMMSTADITLAKNGLPYAVRKQGAGLANLTKAGSTNAYIITYDRHDNSEMDKTKIELGDDPEKTGVYTLTFSVKNFGSSSLSYNIGAHVFTEGVSENKTTQGETTSTQDSYSLNGAVLKVTAVDGGSISGKKLTVGAGESAKVTVTITLSDSDKKYLDKSFENGMYVEGFITLDAVEADSVDLNVPYLAFYGDWTKAPMFDLEYFETSKDELDESKDLLDKTLPDAYASRPVGGTTYDYMSYLGSYYFVQAPGTTMIPAKREHIAISNHQDALNSLRYVWAGMLRNADHAEVTITEDATGEIVYQVTDADIRKSYGDGGPIRPAQIEIEFSAIEQNLKNNTSYTVTVKGYLDYDRDGKDTNVNNTITFPLVTDFQAPTIYDCEFYTEYDRSAKKTKLFAKVAVYDNHYAMALQFGYIGMDTNGEATFFAFDRYPTQVYSDVNSTTYVTYELTDHIDDIANNSLKTNYNNSFVVTAYDYAVNMSTYEIPLPDNYSDFYFSEQQYKKDDNGEYIKDQSGKLVPIPIELSPYEVYDLRPVVYPETEWAEFITYTSTRPNVAKIVGDQIVALSPGSTRIYASYKTPNGTLVAELDITVLGEDSPKYIRYDKPVADKFDLTGYYTKRAFYQLDATERDIGNTGNTMQFIGNDLSLSLFPSEQVQLLHSIIAYFPNDTKIVYEAANENIVTVDANGVITAIAEGYSSVTVQVLMDGKNTFYSHTVSIEVKDPYITTGPSLTHYFGNGGVVQFPKTLAITDIGQFAFTNFDYVPKNEAELLLDDQSTMKPWFLSETGTDVDGFESDITEVYIPEGVKRIGAYAFAGMKNLEIVHLPSTLETIDYGAFLGCVKLKTVEGLGHVKFINQSAFQGAALSGEIKLDSVVAISTYAFAENENITSLILPKTLQSIGAYAFAGDTKMKTLTIESEIFKLGQYAFSGCEKLESASVNSAVISTGAFDGCEALKSMTLGPDVSVIGEHAFRNTAIDKFVVESGNKTYTVGTHEYILSSDGTEILLVAPALSGEFKPLDNEISGITKIADAAFSGNKNITSVYLPAVTHLGNYAFSECTSLAEAVFGDLEVIGNYALHNTAITSAPSFAHTDKIGDYAFARTNITKVDIPSGITIGTAAFASCEKLKEVVIGDNVVIGKYAFLMDSEIFVLKDPTKSTSVLTYEDRGEGDAKKRVYFYTYVSPIEIIQIGAKADIGYGAFLGAAKVKNITLGDGALIGDYAFYNCSSLETMNLEGAKTIGDFAFSGTFYYEFTDRELSSPIWDKETGNYSEIYYTSKLTSIDLSSLESIGECAFLASKKLTSIILGDKLTSIPTGAFGRCDNLETVNLENIETFGSEAFAECYKITSLDLTSAVDIGKYVFCYNTSLESVVFGTDGVTIGEGAFSYCENLGRSSADASGETLYTLTGSDKISYVGDYAFAYTAITDIDLSKATYIGSLAFMKPFMDNDGNDLPPVKFSVKLGNVLADMGDNPFAYCILDSFSSVETITNNNPFKPGTTTKVVYTFDISDSIKIIDGSIYKVVPNGLELITWAGDNIATVADDTVRISAMAFAGRDITSVTLPYTLASIGHKAFFMCQKLSFVAFSSFTAPILEEEFDQAYWNTFENIPATGEFEFTDVDGKEITLYGLGIVPFFMWNASDLHTNGYYGATFVDYIGHIDNKIVMVAPSNGKNYDSFILGQYFSTIIPGATAADATTLAAIAAIATLPSAKDITLEHKALIQSVRAMYDKVLTNDQKALINVEPLTQAEKLIQTLEYIYDQQNPAPAPDTPDTDGTDNNEDEDGGSPVLLIVLITAAVILIAGGAVGAVLILKKNEIIKIGKASDNKESASDSDNSDGEDTAGKENTEAEIEADEETAEQEDTSESTEEADEAYEADTADGSDDSTDEEVD